MNLIVYICTDHIILTNIISNPTTQSQYPFLPGLQNSTLQFAFVLLSRVHQCTCTCTCEFFVLLLSFCRVSVFCCCGCADSAVFSGDGRFWSVDVVNHHHRIAPQAPCCTPSHANKSLRARQTLFSHLTSPHPHLTLISPSSHLRGEHSADLRCRYVTLMCDVLGLSLVSCTTKYTITSHS